MNHLSKLGLLFPLFRKNKEEFRELKKLRVPVTPMPPVKKCTTVVEKPPKKSTCTVVIRINLKYGLWEEFIRANISRKVKTRKLCRLYGSFYHWYFEEHTNQFVFKFNRGECVIQRDSIVSFKVWRKD